MLKIRGVLNRIWILTYNLPPNKPYSNQLQDVINTTSHPQAPIYSSGTKIEHNRWARVWEELVMLKMLINIALPKMGELLVMMMTMISPSGREVPPAESLCRRVKVLLPKFRLEAVTLRLESHLLIFSRSKWLIYQKMGTGGGPGWAQSTRARLGLLVRPGGLSYPVAPLWYLFAPIILKYSIKNPREVSAHLELCRIGSLT